MKKIVLFAQSVDLEGHFAPLRLNLIDQEIELDVVVPSEGDSFLKALAEEKDLALVEYGFFQKLPSLFEEILEKVGSDILLVAPFQDLDDQLADFRELCMAHGQIKGAIDTSRGIQFFYPTIRSVLEKKAENEFDQVGLEKVFDLTQTNLKRLKKIHQKLIPMRSETFGPFSFTSKFIVGTEPGGDFFDVFESHSLLTLIFTRSYSYADMVSVLTHMENLREEGSHRHSVEGLLQTLSDEFEFSETAVKNQGDSSLEFFLMQINLKNLAFKAYSFGCIRLFSTFLDIPVRQHYLGEKSFYEQASFEGELQRGERWLILSSGLAQNLPRGIQAQPVEEYLFNKLGHSPQELASEVSFQIKRRTKGVFPRHNASLLFFEVNSNAITII